MPEDPVERNVLKCNFLLDMLQYSFEENALDDLLEADFKSLDEMDKWADDMLTEFFFERDKIKEYYEEKNAKIT